MRRIPMIRTLLGGEFPSASATGIHSSGRHWARKIYNGKCPWLDGYSLVRNIKSSNPMHPQLSHAPLHTPNGGNFKRNSSSVRQCRVWYHECTACIELFLQNDEVDRMWMDQVYTATRRIRITALTRRSKLQKEIDIHETVRYNQADHYKTSPTKDQVYIGQLEPRWNEIRFTLCLGMPAWQKKIGCHSMTDKQESCRKKSRLWSA